MDLSVVIVNYNVRFFLEQCLHSVLEAAKGLEVEVFVVDNRSVDGSCSMVRTNFPGVRLIENEHNVGFSAANNQAIRLCRGRYILLLNPDTVVMEDCFRSVLAFMDVHPQAGGLGVRMIDGKGRFLKESKRGLPTPWVAFCKMSGLSALFPHSRLFGRYYLGYLAADEAHEVEVLAGAFMLLRKETLDQTGLLDEAFFMYGEDIDLSYRIRLAGYQNWYFPGTTIIHYKGESTRKSSVNYVLVFYRAMIIFARKHFQGNYARTLTAMIQLAVYVRAGLAIIHRIAGIIGAAVWDGLLMYVGIRLLLPYWEQFRLEGGHYPLVFTHYLLPAYILIWLAAMAFLGAYHRPVRLGRVVRGLLAGTGIILLGYGLLPEDLRFSRALILFGFTLSIILLPGWRYLFSLPPLRFLELHSDQARNILIVGSKAEAGRITDLLNQTGIRFQLAGLVNPSRERETEPYLGNIGQLDEIVRVNQADEVIFCPVDLPAGEIIATMHRFSDLRVSFKIAAAGGLSVIGSNSIETAGDLYTITNNSIGKALNRRMKRSFDLLACLLFIPALLFLPVLPPVFRRIGKHFTSLVTGKMSWVGYAGQTPENLPPLKHGIFSPADAHPGIQQKENLENLNLIYSKDYSVWTDILIIIKGIKKGKAGTGQS